MTTVLDEYMDRKMVIAARALQKYGEEALAPKGVEQYDALDFAINELVGIERYMEMVEFRLHGMGYRDSVLYQDTVREVKESARSDAWTLIRVRQSLLKEGQMLGLPEFQQK